MHKSADEQLFAEDFAVGQAFSGAPREINDKMFADFAILTGDAHPIHYDDEYAAKSRYGRRLTHGLLLVSLTALGATTMSRRVEKSMIAFVGQEFKFLLPVFIGDTLTSVFRVDQIIPKPQQSSAFIRFGVDLRNQAGEKVIEGFHTYLFAMKTARSEA